LFFVPRPASRIQFSEAIRHHHSFPHLKLRFG